MITNGTRPIDADGPLRAWHAIASHARDHHGATWASDVDALVAITGAFDAILPSDYGYNPGSNTIGPHTDIPAHTMPRWRDPQMLTCAIAQLAAHPPRCDLQAIYHTANYLNPGSTPPATPDTTTAAAATRLPDRRTDHRRLYLQIADDLATRITNGEWNRRLPGQRQLARQYQTAYGTIKHAVDTLAQRGMVRPRQGQGTMILAQPAS